LQWVLRGGRALPLAAAFFLSMSCTRPPAKTEAPAAEASQVKVEIKPGGPIVLTTSAAEFQIQPSGYIQASLLKGGEKLSLDDTASGTSDSLVRDGKPVQFTLDISAAKVQETGPRQAIRDSSALD
jgi:hypothetical protein